MIAVQLWQGEIEAILRNELFLPTLEEYRVDVFVANASIFLSFGSGQNDLPRNEHQQHDLRTWHAVDEARKQFRLIGRERRVGENKSLETDGKSKITGCRHVLHLVLIFGQILWAHRKTDLFKYSDEFLCSHMTVSLTSTACDYHLS